MKNKTRTVFELKEKLRKRQFTAGSWLTFPCEASAEIMAQAGFDWLVLDMEHAPLGVADAARLIRVIDLSGTPALCRLPSNNPDLAKNVLDAGASGIIVPCVESVEDAKAAVRAAHYPPLGQRGVGLGRAHGYGREFEKYRSQSKNLVVIAMIETERGVTHVREIAKTDGLDALLIGPYDLSGSLGRIGKLRHPDVERAEKKVLDSCEDAGIGCGLHVVHPDPEKIEKAVRQKYTFLALGVDMILLDRAAREMLRIARR